MKQRAEVAWERGKDAEKEGAGRKKPSKLTEMQQ